MIHKAGFPARAEAPDVTLYQAIQGGYETREFKQRWRQIQNDHPDDEGSRCSPLPVHTLGLPTACRSLACQEMTTAQSW